MDPALPHLPLSEAPTSGFDRAGLRERLAALAAKGILLGTSSWKYPGWLGMVYSNERYAFRGQFSEARFQQRCLEEYAATFKTVGVDATYYTLPTERYVAGLAGQVPDDFQFAFKVTDEFTLKRFPPLPRFGTRGGQPNPHFLNADRFQQLFLAPLEGIQSQVGLVMFEFSRFHTADFARGRDFVAALDAFLAQLPTGWRYGVEVRNRSFLHPDFFDLLAARNIAFLFNQWSDGTSLEFQLDQPGCWTAGFGGARLLTRPGTNYEQRERELLPYDQIRQPFPEVHAAAARMVRAAQQRGRQPLFVLCGNKLEGCAPRSVAALAEALSSPTAGTS